MDLDLVLAKCLRRLHADKSTAQLRRTIASLAERNKRSRAPLTASNGPVVSLTSFGKRVESVHLAIESIGQGWSRPSRLILWIDEASIYSKLPPTLVRQQARGLEILKCENFGPHKKYYPYVQSSDEHTIPLVTADDDTIYPLYWLWKLRRANRTTPNTICCFRAHTIGLDKERKHLLPYAQWTRCETRQTSFRVFPTGVGGVIYPPQFLHHLRDKASDFLAKAPRADDVWLHCEAVRNDYPARQVIRLRREPALIPDTQEQALFQENLYANANDVQIAACYTQADVERIQAAPAI